MAHREQGPDRFIGVRDVVSAWVFCAALLMALVMASACDPTVHGGFRAAAELR